MVAPTTAPVPPLAMYTQLPLNPAVLPPFAPTTVTSIELTPAGTVHEYVVDVELKVIVHVPPVQDATAFAAAAGGARATAPARRPDVRLAAPTTDRARRILGATDTW